MNITLKEIAELAGVHKSTVDKVIHNRPGVSDSTRQNIRALLDVHGYETNPLAKALNFQKKRQKIAVILPITDAMPALKAGFAPLAHDFASFNCDVQYYDIPYPDIPAQAACLMQSLAEEVAGILLQPMQGEAVDLALRHLADAHIPVIAVNSLPPNAPHLCFVGADAAQSGRIGARILATAVGNHGTVGILSSSDALLAVREREYAFLQHLTLLAPDIQIAGTINAPEVPDVLYRETRALLARRTMLDALVITCGRVTDICRAVQDAALMTPPRILCYERYAEIEALLRSGEIACAVSSNIGEQARLAARLLFEMVVYGKPPSQRIYLTQNDIIIRETLAE